MSYDGRTEVISGLTRPEGLEPVPLVDASDIYVKDDNSTKGYQSLSEKIEDIDSAIGSGGNIDEKISDAISELDVPDTAITNQFVTAVSETDGKISVTRVQPTAANISGLNDIIDNKIGALDVPDTAITNQFVTAVSETDGVISVTRAQPKASDINGLDTTIDNKIGELNVTDSATENNFVTAVSEANGKVSITRARPSISNVDGLADILNSYNSRLDDLEYEPISISSFTVSPASVEIGSTVTSVTLTWTLSPDKDPKIQRIDSENISVDLRTKTSAVSITTDKTWTLEVTDIRDLVKTRTAKLSFLNKRYWGVSPEQTTYDSSFILGLSNSELSSSRSKSFTISAGVDQHIFYAIPHSFGAPTFTVGGFSGGFSKVASEINFTNASGYTTKYDIWMSDNANLGSTTVVVS